MTPAATVADADTRTWPDRMIDRYANYSTELLLWPDQLWTD